MRIFGVLALIFGLALAGGSLFYTSKFVDAQFGMMRAEHATTVRVLAAKVKLAPGTRLGAADLRWIDWPADSVPSGVYTSTAALFGDVGATPQFVKSSIEPNELILPAKLTNGDQILNGLQKDMRFMSIRIDEVTGVSGFATPGDHVDILMTRDVEGKATTSVIMQDIEIAAIDQDANTERGSARPGRTATVAVTVDQAKKLVLAQQLGRLSLTLIGARDVQQEASAGTTRQRPVTEDDLNDLPKTQQAPGKGVTVRRGSQIEQVILPE